MRPAQLASLTPANKGQVCSGSCTEQGWEVGGSCQGAWKGAGRKLAGNWEGPGRELAGSWEGAWRELAGTSQRQQASRHNILQKTSFSGDVVTERRVGRLSGSCQDARSQEALSRLSGGSQGVLRRLSGGFAGALRKHWAARSEPEPAPSQARSRPGADQAVPARTTPKRLCWT